MGSPMPSPIDVLQGQRFELANRLEHAKRANTELLAALKAYRAQCSNHHGAPTVPCGCNCCLAADALIAKAEGRQPNTRTPEDVADDLRSLREEASGE
jgi:hypothetical protein